MQLLAIERLLADLARYAGNHPNYIGRLDRCDDTSPVFRLRYFGSADRKGATEVEQNEGTQALDNIAGRVMRIMDTYGIDFPAGDTASARVLGWVLADAFVSPCGTFGRSFARPVGGPFEAIREKVLATIEGSDGRTITKADAGDADKGSTATTIKAADDLKRLFINCIKSYDAPKWESMDRRFAGRARDGRGRRCDPFVFDGIGGIYFGDNRAYVFKGNENSPYVALSASHSERIGKKIATAAGKTVKPIREK
jgi:hypothetical protein